MAQCKHCGAPHDMTGKSPGEPVICGCGAMVFAEEKIVVRASRLHESDECRRDARTTMKCPRCGAKLAARSENAATAYDCQTCGGIWFGVETFNTICKEKNTHAAAKNYDAVRRAGSIQKSHPETDAKYLPCPHCGQQMNRRNFAEKSGVIIDICAQDGVWLDKDELRRIVEFIEAGGMQSRPDALIGARPGAVKHRTSSNTLASPPHPEPKEPKSKGWEAAGAIASVGFFVLDILTD